MSILNELTILLETGQAAKAAGQLDIVHINPETAIKYMEHIGFDYKKEMPEFNNNFLQAKEKAKKGWMVRKDMPVITSKDVAEFEKKLSDDSVQVKNKKVRVGDLNPIQKQIYFDTVINDIMAHGIKTSTNHITNKAFIISSDMYIIDGHHRFLTGMLIDPDIEVSVLEVELPINKLLDEAHKFSEELGHQKNESFEDYRKKQFGDPVPNDAAMMRYSHKRYIDANKDWIPRNRLSKNIEAPATTKT